MADELRPPPDPKDDTGDQIVLIIQEGPDGQLLVDTLLRDRHPKPVPPA